MIFNKTLSPLNGHRLKNNKMKIVGGSNWCSLTEPAVTYLLNMMKKRKIKQMFRFTNCADEIYKHTILFNSPFKNQFCDILDISPDLRFIDWEHPNPKLPRTFALEDLNKILSSNCFLLVNLTLSLTKTYKKKFC